LTETLPDEAGKIAFSVTGNYLAVNSNGILRLFDLTSRDPPTVLPHRGANSALTFSPDDAQLTAGTTDNFIRLWDVKRRKQVAQLRGHLAGVWSLVFSPDGRTLASGGDNVVKLWNVDLLQEIFTFPSLHSPTAGAMFSPDGNYLAVASPLDEEERTTVARLRNTASSELSILLRGDLDWIVMRCPEKDRTRRYDTANGLATDIQRYLRNEPIIARPPSTTYLLQKLIRRHRLGFAAALAIFMIVIGGAVISTAQAVRATRAEREQIRLRDESDRARARAEAAEAATGVRAMGFSRLGFEPRRSGRSSHRTLEK
jgi:hypothetical protein